METEPTDKEIADSALRDPEQYRHIIDRYRIKLLRYIGHLGIHDRSLQEDVLQEVFIKVYRNLNGYNPDFPFSSWIYRITHNETISYFRKKKLQPLSIESFPNPDILFSAEEEPKETIDFERITGAVNKLEQKYKEVIVLKYFEDKSYDEIADILEKPPGTVATLLNRAKQKLKTVLTENHYE